MLSPAALKSLDARIEIRLREEELWKRCNALTTEMIVNKLGRLSFLLLTSSPSDTPSHDSPSRSVAWNRIKTIRSRSTSCKRTHGGENLLQMRHCRYKFTEGRWIGPALGIQHAPAGPFYPSKRNVDRGCNWEKEAVEFAVKLTNNTSSTQPNFVGFPFISALQAILQSMQKYLPRLVIETYHHKTPVLVKDQLFPVATFVCVTAYQNTALPKIKIEYNPYARGYKDGRHAKRRQRIFNVDEDKEPPVKRVALHPVKLPPNPVQQQANAFYDPNIHGHCSTVDQSGAALMAQQNDASNENFNYLYYQQPQPDFSDPYFDSNQYYSSMQWNSQFQNSFESEVVNSSSDTSCCTYYEDENV